MNKFWQNNTTKVVSIILLWWATVAATLRLTIHYLPFTPTFPYYNQDLAALYPRFWSTFAHFDGIHYLRIASSGRYPDGGEVAFFPFYPFLIHGLINAGMDRLVAGILISTLSLVLSSLIFAHLYGSKSWKFIFLLLSFPTSFFFAVVYTESLYILLFALMLYFIKEKKYFFASLAVAIATATRFVGIGMCIYLIASLWGKVDIKKIIGLFLFSISGLVSYMFYSWRTIGDPLAFVHVQPTFGMGRSGGTIIWLPQVLFRYAKMLFLTAPNSLVYYRAAAEIVIFAIVVYVLYKVWRHLSTPELLYTLTVLLIPTLSGTLSSYPRYILAAIPLFAVVARLLSVKQAAVIALFQTGFLITAIVLFTRGLFVA